MTIRLRRAVITSQAVEGVVGGSIAVRGRRVGVRSARRVALACRSHDATVAACARDASLCEVAMERERDEVSMTCNVDAVTDL